MGMTREEAITIARYCAKEKPQSYYAEPFQPHEWVIDAILHAAARPVTAAPAWKVVNTCSRCANTHRCPIDCTPPVTAAPAEMCGNRFLMKGSHELHIPDSYSNEACELPKGHTGRHWCKDAKWGPVAAPPWVVEQQFTICEMHWTPSETQALRDMSEKSGLAVEAMVRQGIRVYQLILSGHKLIEPEELAAHPPTDPISLRQIVCGKCGSPIDADSADMEFCSPHCRETAHLSDAFAALARVRIDVFNTSLVPKERG